MKVAVLLSGMMRNFEVTYPKFKEFILDELDCDIFFSGYPNKQGLNYCTEKFKDLYNPKKFIIREFTDELRMEICPNEELYNSRKRPETNPVSFMSGAWNVKQSNELRKSYEFENNIRYDLVFKSRIDWFFWSKITDEEIKMALDNKLMIPRDWDFKGVNPIAVGDQFAISTPEVMDVYCNLYDDVDKYFQMGEIFHPETLMGRHILEKKMDRFEVIGHLPNPYTEYWRTLHGLNTDGFAWVIPDNIDDLSDNRHGY